jgi:hypothetical protein
VGQYPAAKWIRLRPPLKRAALGADVHRDLEAPDHAWTAKHGDRAIAPGQRAGNSPSASDPGLDRSKVEIAGAQTGLYDAYAVDCEADLAA